MAPALVPTSSVIWKPPARSARRTLMWARPRTAPAPSRTLTGRSGRQRGCSSISSNRRATPALPGRTCRMGGNQVIWECRGDRGFYTRRCSEAPALAAPPGAARGPQRGQRGHAGRDPEERRRGVPQARLPRRDGRADRRRAADEEGQPLLLLPQQGRDPLRLPRVLARSAAGAARPGRAQHGAARREAAAPDRRRPST